MAAVNMGPKTGGGGEYASARLAGEYVYHYCFQRGWRLCFTVSGWRDLRFEFQEGDREKRTNSSTPGKDELDASLDFRDFRSLYAGTT